MLTFFGVTSYDMAIRVISKFPFSADPSTRIFRFDSSTQEPTETLVIDVSPLCYLHIPTPPSKKTMLVEQVCHLPKRDKPSNLCTHPTSKQQAL